MEWESFLFYSSRVARHRARALARRTAEWNTLFLTLLFEASWWQHFTEPITIPPSSCYNSIRAVAAVDARKPEVIVHVDKRSTRAGMLLEIQKRPDLASSFRVS